MAETLPPLSVTSCLPLPLAQGSHHSTLYRRDCSIPHGSGIVQHSSSSDWLILHSVTSSRSTVRLHMAGLSSAERPNDILLYGHTAFSVPAHPQEDTCIILCLDPCEYGRRRRAVWPSLQTLVSLLLEKAPAVGLLDGNGLDVSLGFGQQM